LRSDALLIFGCRSFNTTLFFSQLPLLKFSSNLWWQILCFIDLAAVVVTQATRSFGAGNGCQATLGIHNLVGRCHGRLISLVLRRLRRLKAAESVTKPSLDNICDAAALAMLAM
jgi:hypothetical protein